MGIRIKEENGFRFVDEGQGQCLFLLHGLFGALSNWEGVVGKFSKDYRVVIPMLPIYEMPIREAGLDGLRDFVEDFVSQKIFHNFIESIRVFHHRRMTALIYEFKLRIMD